MSRFIVPLRILNISNLVNLPSPGNGMINLYFRNSVLKQYQNAEKDVVLDRILEGYNSSTTYQTILASDTILEVIQKINPYLHYHNNQSILDIIINTGDGTKYLADDGTYKTVTSSGGDVIGPASSTNGNIAVFDGITGKIIKDGGTLSAVATSNNYNDLDNKPTIPAAQVNSDWNSTTGVSEILNKPTIPTDISELTDTTHVIPTDTGDLTNGAGFITGTDVPTYETDPIFSASEAALFAAGDKNKLDGIEEGANNYTHPDTHPLSIIDPTATTTDTPTDTDNFYFSRLVLGISTWFKVTGANLIAYLSNSFALKDLTNTDISANPEITELAATDMLHVQKPDGSAAMIKGENIGGGVSDEAELALYLILKNKC